MSLRLKVLGVWNLLEESDAYMGAAYSLLQEAKAQIGGIAEEMVEDEKIKEGLLAAKPGCGDDCGCLSGDGPNPYRDDLQERLNDILVELLLGPNVSVSAYSVADGKD